MEPLEEKSPITGRPFKTAHRHSGKHHKSKEPLKPISLPVSPSTSCTSMSIDSTSLSVPTSPHNPLSSEHRSGPHTTNDVINLARSVSGARANSTHSREKLVYKQHEDGLINENQQSFDDVDFCFRCDSQVRDPSPMRVSVETGSTAERRPRSQSAYEYTTTGLVKSMERTGYKLGAQGHVPVYRLVFLCALCIEYVKKMRVTEPDMSLKITTKALSYFG